MKNAILLNQKGAILGVVLIFVFISTLVGYGLLQLSGSNKVESVKVDQSSQAFWLAEAGIPHAQSQLFQDWDDRAALESISVGQGTYSVFFYDTDTGGLPLPENKLRIRSTGTSSGISRTVEIILSGLEHEIPVNAMECEGNVDVTGSAEINGDILQGINTAISSVASIGDTSIQIDDTTGLDAGDWVVIEVGTAQEETCQISAVEGATSSITLEEGLLFDHVAGVSVDRKLVFEDVFGVSKEDLKLVAQNDYPDTYYETPFNNDLASEITWINTPGDESQVTSSGWSGSGILIVENDLKMTGGTFTGVIWVMGELNMITGNPLINGAIFIESGATGEAKVAGNAEINYDEAAVQNALSVTTSIVLTVESWRED